MKKNKIKKRVKNQRLQWYTFEEVFKRASKKKEFRTAYNVELSRLRLARRIRELRSSQKLTQKIVAQRAGMPQSVIARMESGERGISVDTLEKVAHAFGKKVQLV